MHFICSTFGSSGDVFPVLGLALALRKRGHRITFATSPHYEGLAAHYELPFEPLGTEEDFMACISDADLWHPKRAFRHVLQSVLPGLRRQYDIHAERKNAGDVVGITNCFGLGALVAQDKLGIPVITVHCQPAVLWSDHEPPSLAGVFGPRWLKGILYRIGERFVIDPAVCPFLNEWRHELGLPPVRMITRWWNSSFGVLCLFPPWYAKPQPDWPANIMQTDFPLWNHESGEPLAGEVEDFLSRGEPPIVFTPGSANIHGRQFFEAAVQACAALGRRGVLLTDFPEQIPGPLPGSVAHFRYVPFDALLPRAAAFVHHGGVGSTSQGMLAGIPQVLMPLAHDQFDNAERIKGLGVGDWIPALRFSGRRLTGMLQGLLASPSVAASCRSTAGRLAARDGVERSADAVEIRVGQGRVAVC
jgi:rhamnosyltransferase subunit B